MAQAAAIAFVAYIVGSFAQGIASIIGEAYRKARGTLIPTGEVWPFGHIGEALSWEQRHGRSSRFVSELGTVSQDAARDALIRLEARQISLLGGLATIDWTRPLVRSTPVRRIYGVDVAEIGGDDEAEHDMARQLLRHVVEESRSAASQEFGVDEKRFEEVVLDSGSSHVPWIAPLFADLLTHRLREEFEQIRTRLLVDQPELFAKVDRLRAEAEFRVAVAPALTGLGLVLIGEQVWVMFVAAALAIVLLHQARTQSRLSDAALVEALRIGRASSPSLDQVKALGTEPWVSEFWQRGATPTGASSSGSSSTS